jgi:NAD dependent epimerase/dehydratase
MLIGKRVLVTGADGFIGSHLTEALVRGGAEVSAFCMYNSNGSLGWLDKSPGDIRSSMKVVLGDIRDERFVETACEGIDVVFHLAALIAIPYSYVAPSSFVQTNVVGTLNVLEAVRRAGCHRLVNTSTSEVYGTPASIPITEVHPLQGQSPYSATKIAADKLAEAYHASFGLPVVTLRPFNTYGPRQSTRAVIPTILAQMVVGSREIRLGSLDPRRDFTYVSDSVAGFMAAASAPGIEGSVIQLGTGETYSIADIFELAGQITGSDAVPVTEPDRIRPEASEVMVLLSDPTRAREVLGWSPRVSLEAGLVETARWVEANLALFNPSQYHV